MIIDQALFYRVVIVTPLSMTHVDWISCLDHARSYQDRDGANAGLLLPVIEQTVTFIVCL